MKRNGRSLIALVLLVGIVVIAVLASLLFYRSGKAQLPWRPLVPTNWHDDSQVFALLNELPDELLDEQSQELPDDLLDEPPKELAA